MTTILFVLAAICADPAAPANELSKGMREYFRRADKLRETKIKGNDTNVAFLLIDINNARDPKVIAELKKQLRRQEQYRESIEKTELWAELPQDPAVGDVGRVRNSGRVFAIINSRTAVVSTDVVDSEKYRLFLVLKNYSTKSLKVDAPVDSEDVFQVTETKIEDFNTLFAIGKRPYRVIEPIKKSDVQRFRALYDAELAAEKVEKEKAAQAKEPAPAQANPSPENP